MHRARGSILERLEQEEREVRRKVLILRRQAHGRGAAPDSGEDKSVEPFEAALLASTGQHDEIARGRLEDKSRALSEALDRVCEGTYGLCRACGCRIPRRRLEALPTATLCVPCQEQRETARAA